MSSNEGLCCTACGQSYDRGVAPESPPPAGMTCRRCGGALVEEAGRARGPYAVVAVRSAVTGQERLPFG